MTAEVAVRREEVLSQWLGALQLAAARDDAAFVEAHADFITMRGVVLFGVRLGNANETANGEARVIAARALAGTKAALEYVRTPQRWESRGATVYGSSVRELARTAMSLESAIVLPVYTPVRFVFRFPIAEPASRVLLPYAVYRALQSRGRPTKAVRLAFAPAELR